LQAYWNAQITFLDDDEAEAKLAATTATEVDVFALIYPQRWIFLDLKQRSCFKTPRPGGVGEVNYKYFTKTGGDNREVVQRRRLSAAFAHLGCLFHERGDVK
jgi:hypothetical protein